MTLLLLAGLLALPVTMDAPFTPQPLALKDNRFHYAVGALTGSADARTRTLFVQPIRGQRAPQTIVLAGPAAQDPAANIVVRDVNFDGQPDLMITSARGNVNSQYAYWLYSAPSQRFVRNLPMSNDLGGYQVTFDAASKRIITASRFSCCEYQTRTYTLAKGSLKLLSSKTEKATAQPTK